MGFVSPDRTRRCRQITTHTDLWVAASSKGDHIDLLHIHSLKSKLREVSGTLRSRSRRYTSDDLRVLLYRTAAVIIATKELDYELLREVAFIPVHAINPPAMHLGVEVWAWLIDKRPDVERKLMVDLYLAWGWTVRRRRGIFSMLLKQVSFLQRQSLGSADAWTTGSKIL